MDRDRGLALRDGDGRGRPVHPSAPGVRLNLREGDPEGH